MPRPKSLTLLVSLALLAAGPEAAAQHPNPTRVATLAVGPRPVTVPRGAAIFRPGFGYYPVPYAYPNFGGYYYLPTGLGLNAGFSQPAEPRAAPLDISGVGFSGSYARTPADRDPKFVPQDTVVTRWRSIVNKNK